jgi:hypothetical protein
MFLVQACVKYLLMSESKEEMQDRFRKEFENIWPGDFLNYFKEKILPKVTRGEEHVSLVTVTL